VTPHRYAVEHWYPDAKGWAEYAETDNITVARAALESADPPEGNDAYDHAMRNVRRRNKRRIFDMEEGRAIEERLPPPSLWNRLFG
jgi:hypothetical protein